MAKNSSDILNNKRSAELERVSLQIFGKVPDRIAFPGGPSRDAFAADMGNDEVFVFARRDRLEDAELEAVVLDVLGETGFAPKLKARVDHWIVQEVLSGVRLPIVLDTTPDMSARVRLVDKALETLLILQDAAMAAGLHLSSPEMGTAENFAWDRTGAAKRMSAQMGIDPPDIDRRWIAQRMAIERKEFTKWDARPGNVLMDDHNAYWFDWEDCGRSCALEDLAFMMCDEWLALDEASETELEAKFFPLFNRYMSADEGMEYYKLFSMIHTVIRLRMALKIRLRDGGWWDRKRCLDGDKIGTTPEETGRLISRGKRIAKFSPQLQLFSPWLDEVADYFNIPI